MIAIFSVTSCPRSTRRVKGKSVANDFRSPNRAGVSAAQHHRTAWLILVVLLLLRIPYVAAIIAYLPIEDQSGGAVYEVGTYLLLAILIWLERARLAEFHIDSLTCGLFLLFRPMQTLILEHWGVDGPLAFPRPGSLFIFGISATLVIALWRGGWKPVRPSRETVGWLVTAVGLGLLLSALENSASLISALRHPHAATLRSLPLITSTSLNIVYHLGFAPINEEPLFRGFLWGYLRARGLREIWIWLIQAALFTLAHVYFAGQYPLQFWFFIPLSGLLLGLLAWRSRGLAPGMLMHALINGSAYMLLIALI